MLKVVLNVRLFLPKWREKNVTEHAKTERLISDPQASVMKALRLQQIKDAFLDRLVAG